MKDILNGKVEKERKEAEHLVMALSKGSKVSKAKLAVLYSLYTNSTNDWKEIEICNTDG